jgi:hypothetical protein
MTKLFDFDCLLVCNNCNCFKDQLNPEGLCYECENKLKETSEE